MKLNLTAEQEEAVIYLTLLGYTADSNNHLYGVTDYYNPPQSNGVKSWVHIREIPKNSNELGSLNHVGIQGEIMYKPFTSVKHLQRIIDSIQ